MCNTWIAPLAWELHLVGGAGYDAPRRERDVIGSIYFVAVVSHRGRGSFAFFFTTHSGAWPPLSLTMLWTYQTGGNAFYILNGSNLSVRENEKIALYVRKSEYYLFFFTFLIDILIYLNVFVCIDLLLFFCHLNPVVVFCFCLTK